MGEVGNEVYGQEANEVGVGEGEGLDLLHVAEDYERAGGVDEDVGDDEIGEVLEAGKPDAGELVEAADAGEGAEGEGKVGGEGNGGNGVVLKA